MGLVKNGKKSSCLAVHVHRFSTETSHPHHRLSTLAPSLPPSLPPFLPPRQGPTQECLQAAAPKTPERMTGLGACTMDLVQAPRVVLEVFIVFGVHCLHFARRGAVREEGGDEKLRETIQGAWGRDGEEREGMGRGGGRREAKTRREDDDG